MANGSLTLFDQLRVCALTSTSFDQSSLKFLDILSTEVFRPSSIETLSAFVTQELCSIYTKIA